ncbi:MAG: hypothetical protein IJM30_08115 [Thermoguttaceae bacterium]|nr:hypothetical protein [Thermoguttaceae bacterium]
MFRDGLVFLALFLSTTVSALGADNWLRKEGTPLFPNGSGVMETTPVVWKGRAVVLASIRPATPTHEPSDLKLRIVDLADGAVLAEFGAGTSLASAFVEKRADGDVFRVFAARQPEGESWFRNIVEFSSRDLKTWTERLAIEGENENLLNSSVCRDKDGYLMAYESNSPVSFCFKFARSKDLERWEKIPDIYYAGTDGATYSACPVVRRVGDYYCAIYLRANGKGGFESAAIRSKNLVEWEESPRNPILAASGDEGINNSDVDLFEWNGETQLFYATGNQSDRCDVRRALFQGTEAEFWAKAFEAPEPVAEEINEGEGFGENLWTGDPCARKNVYVSKLGDDSDGATWETAYRSVRKALDNLPESEGGVRVIVRPDRYFEPNLLPSRKGARGAYNELVGDVRGEYGSGATGWVYLDSSDPEKGFKSYDWHSSIRAYMKGWSSEHTGETVSSLMWDRWIVRGIYATGGDAGLFWDCLDETAPFTVLVEDCVSIGRAFGMGVAFGAWDASSPNTRDDEPIVFRRVWAASLDRWGDAGAAFLRSYRPELAPKPEFYLDDCVLVSPDNAIENNVSEYDGSTHIAARNCKMIVLNFTQPAGQPQPTGVIRTPNDGSRYLIELEDCDLMGCKIFSDEKPNPPQYRAKGRVRAYTQFQHSVPEGMKPFEGWPSELFQYLAPPAAPTGN